jgi:membrane fusion protein, multidrug efflux system
MEIFQFYRSLIFTAGILLTTSAAAEPAPGAPKGPPKVDVFIVGTSKDISIPLEYPARLSSIRDVTVMSRVTGVLQKKYYTEGKLVRKGEILYKIEPDTYAANVQSAKASLALENAKLEKAQKDWERADGLFKDKAISEQDKDAAYYTYKTAFASANIAKASLRKANVDLGYTEVRATISGVAGMKMVDVGDLVKEGTSLVSITQTDPIFAEFSIPDINGLKKKYQLQKGSWNHLSSAKLQASLEVDGKLISTKGRVDFVDSHLDKATSTLKLRAIFENSSSSLLAGSFVKVKINGVMVKNCISIPQKAVLQTPLGSVVFTVVKGKVVPKPVKILDTVDQMFTVDGVMPNDIIMVNNFFRAKPGDTVIIDKTLH